jgi:hypothetical protein
MLRAGSHRLYLARTFGRNVDASGFFENQLTGGTWMTFDQSISGIRVQSIVTNFDGSLNTTPLVRSSLMHGSYIKINGTVVASDHSLAPDGTDNRVDSMNRGTTSSDPGSGGIGNQYGVGFWMQRGHTIVVLNPTDGTIRPGFPKCYDTYIDPTTYCDSMVTDLLAVAAGDVVAIGTFDATGCNQNLRDALTYLFGDTDYTNTWPGARISHMFLGKRKQYITGLWRSLYNGYFGEGADGGGRGKQANSPTWFDTQTPTESIQVTDFSKPNIGVSLASAQWLGYFRAPHTADYTFYITSDDESYFWIGNNAVTNYTTTNADIWTWVGLGEIASNPISLEQGTYYPIRSQWGNATGVSSFSISWSNTITAKTDDFSGLLYYNTAGPGFDPVPQATIHCPDSMNEGDSITVDLVTWGIPDGTELRHIFPVFGLDPATRFSVSPRFPVVTNNRASFYIEVFADHATAPGSQSFDIIIQNKLTGLTLATKYGITVNDTSGPGF